MQQVACGFMQLVAAGCMLNIQHFYSLFEGKCYLCFRMLITIFKTVIP